MTGRCTFFILLWIFLSAHLQTASAAPVREQLPLLDGTTGYEARGLCQDETGYIWMATDRGLLRYDGYTINRIPMPADCEAVLTGMSSDTENSRLWLFNSEGQTLLFDLKAMQFEDFPQGKQRIPSFTHHYLGGLYLWQYGTEAQSRRIRRRGEISAVEEFPVQVKEIRTDEAENDWIRTDSHLFLNGFEEPLPESDDIKAIAIYRSLCLALTAEGVTIYNAARRIVRHTPYLDNLRKDLTESLVSVWASNDLLVISCPHRTWTYHIIDGTFSPLNEKEQPERPLLPTDTLLTDRSGCLWVAPKGGQPFLRRDEARFTPNEVPYPPTVTLLVGGGNSFIPGDNRPELPYTSQLTIEFSNFCYARLSQVRYQYYLEGVETEWCTPHTAHTAAYHNLSPGEYTFHVRAAVGQSEWSVPTTYTFTIRAPWWSAWSVRLCILLAALTLFVWLAWRFRHRQSPSQSIPEGKETETGNELSGKSNSHPTQELIKEEKTEEREVIEESVPVSQPLDDALPSEPTLPADEQVPSDTSVTPSAPTPISLTPRDRRFKARLLEVIHEHLGEADFHVEQLATEMELGRSHLYNRTKQVTGLSPSDLLRNVRLNEVARLLVETDLPIEEIFRQCGFTNGTKFYRFFKESFGMTPSRYRKKTD